MSSSAPSIEPPSLAEQAAANLRHPLSLALLALTFSTGTVDAVSYLGLGHVFTANMTGNVVLVGFGIARAGGLPVVAPIVSMAAFVLGTMSNGARPRGGGFAAPREFAAPAGSRPAGHGCSAERPPGSARSASGLATTGPAGSHPAGRRAQRDPITRHSTLRAPRMHIRTGIATIPAHSRTVRGSSVEFLG